MPDWPLVRSGGGPVENAGAQTGSSRGVTVTSGTGAKGAWAQLIAATTRETDWLEVDLGSPATATDYVVDIGIGGAGAEQVLLPNLIVGSGTGAGARSARTWWPVKIPAGTRIAARCQASVASAACRAMALLGSSGFVGEPGLARVVDYGTSIPQGTTVDPGGTANTKGSWVQLVASTTNRIGTLLLGASNLGQTARTTCEWLVDIGIGGAGSETVLLSNVHYECVSTEDTIHPQGRGPYYVEIPAGTRLAARAQCSINTVTVRNIALIAYGIG